MNARRAHGGIAVQTTIRSYGADMATAVLKIEGMTCSHCVRAVTEALESVEGVEHVNVNLADGRAVVDYRDGAATPGGLVVAVIVEGYMAEEVA
jgi:copper chaperone